MAVEVIDKIKPKNGGSFPIVEAVDVEVRDGLRLLEALAAKANADDVTTADASLQSQIDQIAQAAGTGSADTEVAQARVSSSGTTYNNLKSRLDSENTAVNTALLKCMSGSAVQVRTSDDLDSADHAEKNRIYLVTSNGTVENIPANVGILITYKDGTTSQNGFVQNFIDADGIPYTRIYINNRWSAWTKSLYTNDCVTILGQYATSSDLASADDAEMNKVYFFASDGTIEHLPARMGTMLTMKGNTTSTTGKTQIFIDDTGKTYTRFFKSWVWSDWNAPLYTNDSFEILERVSSSDDLDSANNAENNKLYFVVSDGTIGNIPETFGTMLTMKAIDSSPSGKVQLFVNSSGEIYTRFYSGGSWSDWKKPLYASGSFETFEILGRLSSSADLDSANNALSNKVYFVVSDGTIENLPENFGVMLTMKGIDSSPSGKVQIFVNDKGETYTRFYTARGWSKWKIPLYVSGETFTFAMFATIGVVGDSYASGAYGDAPGSSAVEHYNYSWPAMIGRRNGVEINNFSYGGLSTKTWLTNAEHGLAALTSTSACDIYILALERNDYNRALSDSSYLGSIDDITNYASYEDYPDSFYGNYGKIIEQIMAYAPHSKLIMMSGDYTNELGVAFNDAVQEIAEHYEIPCMVQTDDVYFSSPEYKTNWPSGSHPGRLQYQGMATAIERMFNIAAKTNMEYFKYY